MYFFHQVSIGETFKDDLGKGIFDCDSVCKRFGCQIIDMIFVSKTKHNKSCVKWIFGDGCLCIPFVHPKIPVISS